jgi:hypothetical protein
MPLGFIIGRSKNRLVEAPLGLPACDALDLADAGNAGLHVLKSPFGVSLYVGNELDRAMPASANRKLGKISQ